MELIKKIVKGIGIAFFALMALVAFAGMKSPLGGLLFLLGGAMFTPLGSMISARLPGTIRPKLFMGGFIFVLFIAACVVASGGSNKNTENTVAEEPTEESVSENEVLVADSAGENDSRSVESSSDTLRTDNNDDEVIGADEPETQDEAGQDENGVTDDTAQNGNGSDADNSTSEAVMESSSAQTDSDQEVSPVSVPVEPSVDTSVGTTPTGTQEPGNAQTTEPTPVQPAPVQPAVEPVVDNTPSTTITYVLNTNTMKCHVPSCGSVKNIKPENRRDFYGTAEEARAMGYDACGNCHPW